jgi:hypothetical protein
VVQCVELEGVVVARMFVEDRASGRCLGVDSYKLCNLTGVVSGEGFTLNRVAERKAVESFRKTLNETICTKACSVRLSAPLRGRQHVHYSST